MATLEVNKWGKYNLATRRGVSSHIVKAGAMRQAGIFPRVGKLIF